MTTMYASDNSRPRGRRHAGPCTSHQDGGHDRVAARPSTRLTRHHTWPSPPSDIQAGQIRETLAGPHRGERLQVVQVSEAKACMRKVTGHLRDQTVRCPLTWVRRHTRVVT